MFKMFVQSTRNKKQHQQDRRPCGKYLPEKGKSFVKCYKMKYKQFYSAF